MLFLRNASGFYANFVGKSLLHIVYIILLDAEYDLEFVR